MLAGFGLPRDQRGLWRELQYGATRLPVRACRNTDGGEFHRFSIGDQACTGSSTGVPLRSCDSRRIAH